MVNEENKTQENTEERAAMIASVLEKYPEAKTEEELFSAMEASRKSAPNEPAVPPTEEETPQDSEGGNTPSAPAAPTETPAEQSKQPVYGERLGGIAARRANRNNY